MHVGRNDEESGVCTPLLEDEWLGGKDTAHIIRCVQQTNWHRAILLNRCSEY